MNSRTVSSRTSLVKSCGCKPVLVVDDNDFNLYTFIAVIGGYKLEADGASNGKLAI